VDFGRGRGWSSTSVFFMVRTGGRQIASGEGCELNAEC
jgi:hypothetical protein